MKQKQKNRTIVIVGFVLVISLISLVSMGYFGSIGTDITCPNDKLQKFDLDNNCQISSFEVKLAYAALQSGGTTQECVSRVQQLYLQTTGTAYYPLCGGTTQTTQVLTTLSPGTTAPAACFIGGCGQFCRNQCDYQVSKGMCSTEYGVICKSECIACATTTTTLAKGCPENSEPSKTIIGKCECLSGYKNNNDNTVCIKDDSDTKDTQDMQIILITVVVITILIFYSTILMQAKKSKK